MNFSTLSDCHKKWQNILVIGKTIERGGRKYHILGMTLSDEAKLYIIEPYDNREPVNRKGVRNYRRRLKEYMILPYNRSDPSPPGSSVLFSVGSTTACNISGIPLP